MFTFLNRLLHASIILLTAASLSFLHISSILYTSSFLTHLEVGFRRLISVVPICSIYTNLNIYIYTFDNRHSLYFSTSAPSPGRIRGSPRRGRVLTATLDPDHPTILDFPPSLAATPPLLPHPHHRSQHGPPTAVEPHCL